MANKTLVILSALSVLCSVEIGYGATCDQAEGHPMVVGIVHPTTQDEKMTREALSQAVRNSEKKGDAKCSEFECAGSPKPPCKQKSRAVSKDVRYLEGGETFDFSGSPVTPNSGTMMPHESYLLVNRNSGPTHMQQVFVAEGNNAPPHSSARVARVKVKCQCGN
jgi:hypothetical protein